MEEGLSVRRIQEAVIRRFTAISRASQRPVFSHGIQSGDVRKDSGIVWARADRPSLLEIEVSTTEDFATAIRLPPAALLPEGDLAGSRLLSNLPAEQEIFYRMTLVSIRDPEARSESITGRFRTAPGGRRNIRCTAAHYYNPERAAFTNFKPFWEFVSGHLHAGTFVSNDLDMTFGQELRYVNAPTAEQGVNLPRSVGLQFFALVDIDCDTRQMTVRLMDRDDNNLYSVTLDPVV